MCPRLTVPWIVHSWLSSLRSRVSKVNSALDCPFLIAPSISCVQSWQCLWIVHSWLLLQSRVPKVDSALDCPSLDCSFNLVCLKLTVLWIVHSWLLPSISLSKVDFAVALDCPFLIAPSISCAQSRQCSGLSILDCSFNLVCPKLTVLWMVPFLIVPTVFSNVYLSVSLDCQFLISPSISCSQGLQCSGLSILDCSFNLVYPKLTVLWIVHSWLSSLRFSLTFICQCLWIVHSWLFLQSRVSKVRQCSGLSILDCSFNLVCPRLTVLWIVHSWLLLQSRVPKLTVLWIVHYWLPLQSRVSKVNSALDCQFLIAPSISCAQSWQCCGLSILECLPLRFSLTFNCQCLWIVHSWLLLQSRVSQSLAVLWIVHSWLLLQSSVPKVDSALDCPFLIVVLQSRVVSNVY